MKLKSQTLIDFFQQHNGVVRFSSILKAGFHPDMLHDLQQEGKVEKIARGLYRMSQYPFNSYPDLILASLQAPRGIICLLSALAFHETTNEIPRFVDIAIPAGTRANKIAYPPVRFYHFSPKAWELGIEQHQFDRHRIRVYCLAKTLADCFKFRNKIGTNIATEALKSAVSEKNINPQEIMAYAKICRVDKIMKPLLEILI